MKHVRNFLIAALVALSAAGVARAAIWDWSLTPANNGTADPTINWAEGQSPSSVNNSARAMMSAIAAWRNDISGVPVTTGTATAYTLTSSEGFNTTPSDGQMIAFKVHVANGVAPTLVVDGGNSYPIQTSGGVAVGSGVLALNARYVASFNSTNSSWLLHGFYNSTIAAGSIVTSMLADAAVTYAKLQNIAANTLIGRYTASTGVPQAVTVSTGLNLDTTTGNLTSAYPPAGAYRNLAIKVTGNTGLTVTADYVTTTNGTSFQTTPVSCTINMGTTGINAIDTGSIASATWYAIWINAQAGGTTGCTASLQFTANATFLSNQPSGYTYYARVGAIRTASGVAQLLGTWQFGNRVQYKLGLAQTGTSYPSMGSLSNVTPTQTAITVSNFVPTTAIGIRGSISVTANSGSQLSFSVNPNSSPSAATSMLFGVLSNAGSSFTYNTPFEFLLESSSIYYTAGNSTAGIMYAVGWDDSL